MWLYDARLRNDSQTCTVSHIQVEAMLSVMVETSCLPLIYEVLCDGGGGELMAQESDKQRNRNLN